MSTTPPTIVPDRFGRGIEIERVDGEVAAHARPRPACRRRCPTAGGRARRSCRRRVCAARNVDTSMTSLPTWTWTRRKRRPMMNARRNSGLTCSGVASVAMSKSLGSMPSSRSRTAPPTMNALKPSSCSRRVTERAAADSWSRRTGCSSGRVDAGSGAAPAGQQAGEQAANHLEPVHAMATNALERETPLRGGGPCSSKPKGGGRRGAARPGATIGGAGKSARILASACRNAMVCASKRRPAPSRIIEGLRRADRASPGTASATCQETPCTNT